jgi:hypothetical protein
MTQEESVPIGELQALVEEWRNPPDDVPDVAVELIGVAADELQAVIEDYE